jgi:hypothetical protein
MTIGTRASVIGFLYGAGLSVGVLILIGGGHGPALPYVVAGSPLSLFRFAPAILFPAMWSAVAACAYFRKDVFIGLLLLHYTVMPFALISQTRDSPMNDVRVFVDLCKHSPVPAAIFFAFYFAGQVWLWTRLAAKSV